MKTQRNLPILEVYGSHEQMGQQIGETFKEQIIHSLENARVLLADAYESLHLTWEGAQIQARKYIPFAQEAYPQYVDEMLGISEGANVPFDEICVLNTIEAVTSDALHLTKCTSMAVNQKYTKSGNVLVAHNEDWVPEDEPDVFLINARPDDEPPFLAMTYGGLLPNIGMNAAGICQMCDSVYPNDSRIGTPRVIVSRAVLGSTSPSQAIRSMVAPLRAAGYNHLLAHESGELYNIEVSARNFAMIYGGEKGRIAHTNHYLDRRMQAIESDPDEMISTRVRYHRAERLLSENDRHTVASLQGILSDHINLPDSICNHAVVGDPLDREKTICSLVMDLGERKMYACWGNPCQNEFTEYTLKT